MRPIEIKLTEKTMSLEYNRSLNLGVFHMNIYKSFKWREIKIGNLIMRLVTESISRWNFEYGYYALRKMVNKCNF
jgi:hypothetical protein